MYMYVSINLIHRDVHSFREKETSFFFVQHSVMYFLAFVWHTYDIRTHTSINPRDSPCTISLPIDYTENCAEFEGLDRRGIHNSIGAPASEWSFVTGPRTMERGLYGTSRKEEANEREREREKTHVLPWPRSSY